MAQVVERDTIQNTIRKTDPSSKDKQKEEKGESGCLSWRAFIPNVLMMIPNPFNAYKVFHKYALLIVKINVKKVVIILDYLSRKMFWLKVIMNIYRWFMHCLSLGSVYWN